MKWMHMVGWILIVVGGVNWGLVGLGGFMASDWNLVHMILGSWSSLESLVYVLVGLAAVYEVINHKNTCKNCGMSSNSSMM
ncbi:MAG: DUF378 domain-containing protein [bacterium]|nr:DUF378 domain-containing protein [bacterium]